jgi:hypothetical protein
MLGVRACQSQNNFIHLKEQIFKGPTLAYNQIIAAPAKGAHLFRWISIEI